MCGIVGYTGSENALPILLKGLYSLEYRGYDSAGIAAFTKDGLRVVKTQGRIANLEEKIKEEGGLDCTCGIGHTRWRRMASRPTATRTRTSAAGTARARSLWCTTASLRITRTCARAWKRTAIPSSPRPTRKRSRIWWITCIPASRRISR